MVTTAESLRERQDDLLKRYLRALAREGGTNEMEVGRGRELRTCPECGERAIARLEPSGTWHVCSACGRYA